MCTWTIRDSQAHHEAGHVVVARLLGLEVSESRIHDPDGGGSTFIESIVDVRHELLVALAGIVAQIVFDAMCDGVPETHVNFHRRGMAGWDLDVAGRCIRRLTALVDQFEIQRHYDEISEELVSWIAQSAEWNSVHYLATQLSSVGTVHGKQLDEILRSVGSQEVQLLTILDRLLVQPEDST